MSIVDMIRDNPRFAVGGGVVTGAGTSAADLPIADYDKQTAQDIAGKLQGLSQSELGMIGAHEAKHENRATITDRIAKLLKTTDRDTND
jgi:hypothetical protein